MTKALTIDRKTYASMTRGERISAVKRGLIPSVRSERERQLRSRYNMMLEHYDEMLAAQDHVCAACGQEWRNDLYVDHNHSTDEVRGLLCANCNTIVGYLETQYERLWDCIIYLAQTGSALDE